MTRDAATTPPRRRIVLAVLAVGTVGFGLLAHRVIPGTLGDIAGDALYALLIYVIVAFAMPRCRPLRLALLAFAICAGIELFQLTGLPRVWAEEFPPVGLVLGTGFDARDIIVYAVAVAIASVIDALSTRNRPTISS